MNTIDLVVTIIVSPGADEQSFRLAAGPDGVLPESTVPDAQAAYDAVVRYGERLLLPALPPKGAGQEISAPRPVFGGPERAHVTGTLNGRAVSQEFSRTDSRETARWDALGPLFGSSTEA
ncbi:serine protease inhibitor [Arthrobacter sp. NPDC090010]|uniref:serine protease inhibitor n=1 Tax=Arthrobacter sp. NPDC090010 TaxID=3363942 RepID=UPI003817CB4F